MRYFLLFTIALCSMNLYSQEALKERRYISEDGDMVILNDKSFLFVVYQSSHQPTWWSDTLAICDVEAISESLLKITNKNKVEDMCKLIEVDYQNISSLGDSVRIQIEMPYDYDNLEISICSDMGRYYNSQKKIITIPRCKEKHFQVYVYPRNYIPHSIEGIFYGLLYFMSPQFVLKEEYNLINISFPFLNNGFFERYYIKEDYIYYNNDTLYWKGKLFKINTIQM